MTPLLALVLQLAAPAPPPRAVVELVRPLPESCSQLEASLASAEPERREREWNESYKAGWEAIDRGDLELAGRSICRALADSRSFDARDVRFAETLDELGLLHFRRRDLDAAERAQGAAVAELLLAAGPRHGDVDLYLSRLGQVLQGQERDDVFQDLRRAPYRIFEHGHVPLERELASRLDWLVSQYLLAEDMKAASALQDLVARITASERD